LPVDQQHQADDRHENDDRVTQVADADGDEGLDRAHIVGRPRHDVAGADLLEEALVEFEHVGEELTPQFRLHPVAEPTEAQPPSKLTQSGATGRDHDGQCEQRDASFLSARDGVNRLPQVKGREELQPVR